MTPLLEARHVTRVFNAGGEKEFAALRGVDVVLAEGELIAIMGPSGCGKSTLLNVLGGLDRPTSGEVWLGGERVDRLNERQWAKRRRTRVGFVFQFFNLVENLTAADNVELPGLIAGLSVREARERRMGLLERLGVADRAHLLPAKLSGGERQRVAIARAVINRPRVLFADEPTGSLDSQSSREVLALFREMHAAGQAIVLVTHDAAVAAIAGRVLHMQDGRLAAGAGLQATAEPMAGFGADTRTSPVGWP